MSRVGLWDFVSCFYKGAAFAFNYHAGAAVNDSVVESRGRMVILRIL